MKGLKAVVGAAALLIGGSALATPVNLGGSETNLQQIINGLYTAAGTPTALAPNVNTDQANEVGKFVIEASGGSIATFVISIAGHGAGNRFGIYDLGNTANRLQLFNGAAPPGGQVTVTVNAANLFRVVDVSVPVLLGQSVFSGNEFGFYLTNGFNETFFSEAARNGAAADHMVAYRGDGDWVKLCATCNTGPWGLSSYLLAWEDTVLAQGDSDYNDLVVYVESIAPVVPEPATLGLLGAALAAFGFARRRRA